MLPAVRIGSLAYPGSAAKSTQSAAPSTATHFAGMVENERTSLQEVLDTLKSALAEGKITDIKLQDRNRAILKIGGQEYLFYRGGYHTLTRRYTDTMNYETRFRHKTKARPVVKEVRLVAQRLYTNGRPAILEYSHGTLYSPRTGLGCEDPNNLTPVNDYTLKPDYVTTEEVYGTHLRSDLDDSVALEAEQFFKELEKLVFTPERVNEEYPKMDLVI